ncbi:uncharacterized protein tp53i13 isoform X1 [Hemiscyllium ocellatum]|uniref:uncharacterized protein tp53i13 isoform X1 n=2 Tax=Hemiscyllium ocellatum TaxID=170820 RepID=UPI002966FBBE|nr:uncharacterized protein tp53i13 isoform X1 [Hemiscyllium ocellatum]
MVGKCSRSLLGLLVLLLGLPGSPDPCDDGRFKRQMDLPPMEEYVCSGPTWSLPERVIPSLAKVYPEQEAACVCMGERIEYNEQIPNSGMFRPIWAAYGEYLYVPPQRWVHNLQRGGVAFLYHPCVHPRLKEELSLLARACKYQHIITPHLNLSQQWPLALVTWGKSLEMSTINVAEAVSWLRESVNQARSSEMEEVGAYNYLLIWRAKLKSASSDQVTCPENQVKELQDYFKKSELQSAIRKGNNKVGVNVPSKGLHMILRRRRDSSHLRESTQPSRLIDGTSSRAEISSKMHVGSTKNMSIVNQSANLTGQPSGPAVITGDSEKITGSKIPGNQEIGEGEQNKRNNLMSTFQKVDAAPHSEAPGSKAHQQTFPHGAARLLNSSVFPIEQLNSRHQNQMHNMSDSSLDSQVKAQRTESSSQEHVKSGASITDKANRQILENPVSKEQQMVKIIVNSNHVPDSRAANEDTGQIPQNGSKVSGENAKPLQLLQTSETSSKNDVGMKQSDELDSGKFGSDRIVQKVELKEPDIPKSNRTAILNAQDDHNETAAVNSAKVNCKCEGAASQNIQPAPASADSNPLKAGILEKTQHHDEDRTLYIPTPRTEEAAWAAAALAFLFVFLTLAVLYTRLYRKFIKSDSLYWTPVPGIDGQETVADVIKRRLSRFSKRRKKRPLYKKSISPYDVLSSDNSD